MAKPSCVEDRILLAVGGGALFLQGVPIFAECNLQPLEDLHGDVGLEANLFGQKFVSLLLVDAGCKRFGALLVHSPDEFIARDGKLAEVGGNSLQIDEVVGLLRIFQRWFRRLIAPPIRLRAKPGYALRTRSKKSRHGGG